MRTATQTCMFNIRNFVNNPKRKFPFFEISKIEKMIEANEVPPTAVKIYKKAL
jgi:hypothetical protein